MIKEKNISFNSNGQLLDLYLPDSGNIRAIFLFFHGGGIEAGSKEECENFAEYLLCRDIAVVSANYRMFPDTKFPEFLEDAADAVNWIYNNKKRFDNCNKLFVGGSSAGGYISMMLCFDKRYLAKHNIKHDEITGYIHDSRQPTKHFNVLKYSGLDSRRIIIDETAPLYYIGVEEDYSPMLFLVADNDMKNRYEQTMLVLSTLRHFGYDESKIKYQLMHGKHCEHCPAKDENGDSVFGKIIFDFISSVI